MLCMDNNNIFTLQTTAYTGQMLYCVVPIKGVVHMLLTDSDKPR